MGIGINRVKKNVFRAAAVAGIVILLVFTVGCTGGLLGVIAQEAYIGIELPKTGQTTSYDTRDDGDLQMGVTWPVSRFAVGTGAESVCITDNLTGLMWEQAPSNTARTWSDALTYANSLSLGDHTDWRLPNRKELRSLVNYGVSNSADWLNNTIGLFTGVQAGDYWSSTTFAPNTPNAWLVDMSSGYVYGNVKTDSYYVLAVRSGQAGGTVSLPKTGQTTVHAAGDDGDLEKGVAWPVPRFTVGTGAESVCITDNLTGLMWEQAPSGKETWLNALSYANGLSLGGHSDWRLPNANELESLINAGQAEPGAWLNSQSFSGVQADYYWSSTTYTPNNANAWRVTMCYGYVGYGSKADSEYVLAVRSGQ